MEGLELEDLDMDEFMDDDVWVFYHYSFLTLVLLNL